MQREDAASLLLNSWPMEFGVWEYVRTNADGQTQAPQQEDHCETGFLTFTFRAYIPAHHRMNSNHGLGFKSEKVGDGIYRVQSAVFVDKIGETLAVHIIRMQGSKAFDDQIQLKSKLGTRHASMTGRWLRGCKC